MSVSSEKENKDIVRIDYWRLREELTTSSKALYNLSYTWGKCLADLNDTGNAVQIEQELGALAIEAHSNLVKFVESLKSVAERYGCDMAEQSIAEAVERSDAARAAWIKRVNEEYDND